MNSKYLSAFCFVFTTALGLTFGSRRPVVHTSIGSLEGRSTVVGDRVVEEYLGVPYAQPPLGELRFKRPLPVKPWAGLRKAVTKRACVQFSNMQLPWYDPEPGTTEDCLTLNIYVPKYSNEPKAVLYFMHGGAFNMGSNRMPLYDGKHFARYGNVIVVIPNFRLGVLGFFTTRTEDAPGNQGLYDLLEGLKWVNRNIASFGGDPNEVTIAGESSGSNIVSLFSASPLTSPLYKRAILESGSADVPAFDDTEYNIKLGQTLAKNTKCADDDQTFKTHPQKVAECLRNKSAIDLAKTAADINPTALLNFLPQFRDSLLPKNVHAEIEKDNFEATEMLIGNNRDEGSCLMTIARPDIFGTYGEKDATINKTLGAEILKQSFPQFPDVETLINFYLGKLKENDYDGIRKQVYTAIGDSLMVCPTLYFTEKNSKRNPNTFYYFFSHRPSKTIWAKWMEVVHFEEVQFVFGRPLRVPGDYTVNEKQLSLEMMTLWSNFVKQGSPRHTWPPYNKDTREMFVIQQNKNIVERGPHLESCEFLRSYLTTVGQN